MIKGLIFDYGGTLDTGGNHWGKVIWHAYEHGGVPVGEELFRDAYVYAERELARNPIIQPDYTFRRTLQTKLHIEMEHIETRVPGFAAADWCDIVVDHLYTNVEAEVKRSRTILLELKQRYPMVLVSNFYGNLTTVLHEFDLHPLFSSIIESAVVGIRKPDPRLFALGVEALHMPATDVVVVGDSYEKDIMPAKTVGCRTIWMKGEGWTDEGRSDTSAADIVVADMADVPTALIALGK